MVHGEQTHPELVQKLADVMALLLEYPRLLPHQSTQSVSPLGQEQKTSSFCNKLVFSQ